MAFSTWFTPLRRLLDTRERGQSGQRDGRHRGTERGEVRSNPAVCFYLVPPPPSPDDWVPLRIIKQTPPCLFMTLVGKQERYVQHPPPPFSRLIKTSIPSGSTFLLGVFFSFSHRLVFLAHWFWFYSSLFYLQLGPGFSDRVEHC